MEYGTTKQERVSHSPLLLHITSPMSRGVSPGRRSLSDYLRIMCSVSDHKRSVMLCKHTRQSTFPHDDRPCTRARHQSQDCCCRHKDQVEPPITSLANVWGADRTVSWCLHKPSRHQSDILSRAHHRGRAYVVQDKRLRCLSWGCSQLAFCPSSNRASNIRAVKPGLSTVPPSLTMRILLTISKGSPFLFSR